MSYTDSALSELRAQSSHFIFPAIAESAFERLVPNLSELAEKSVKRVPRFQRKTGLNPEEVWAKWQKQDFAPDRLVRREWQTLCGSPLTALRSQLIESLRTYSEPIARLANFVGIAATYFRYWRPEDPQFASATIIEEILLRELERTYSGSNNRVIQTWKKFPQLFGPRAAEWVAEISLRDRTSVAQAAQSVFIEPTALLTSKSLDLAAVRATAEFLRRPGSTIETNIIEYFDWMKDKLFVPELSPETFRKSLGDLIVSSMPDRYPMLRQSITQIVNDDDRLGDPRLVENGGNWRHLPNETREIFLSWLAQQYIQLFFDIVVPKSDENRRRAEFWLHYAKRKGNIKDFQVAVSSEDLWKVQRSQEARGFSYARVSASSNASSAFLMEFHTLGERYIVVDFSETGNAACIYTKATFEATGASLRRRSFSMTELRNIPARLDSINHIGSWEVKAQGKLRRLGITQ
jgi:hypothetical protein